MQKIGVTGASGFIGSRLVSRLADEPDIAVRALTRTLASTPVAHNVRAEWTEGDLASHLDCAAFVDGLDAIVHLAHTNTPFTSNKDLPGDAALNVLPTVTLLQAILDARTKPHVIYASTGGALYRGEVRRPFDEDSPVEPTTSYGIQKLMGEHYLRLGAREGWLTATSLRIGNPYGVLLPAERRQGFVGVALSRLLEGRPVHVFGDADNVRDYVHLEDVMRMFELALEQRDGWNVYNVGSGEGRTVREVLALLQEFSGISGDIRYEPLTADSRRLPPWVVLDCTKARRDLGWEPRVSFTDGLRALCQEAVAAAM
jgi:UDP-glucose 4-epimerase